MERERNPFLREWGTERGVPERDGEPNGKGFATTTIKFGYYFSHLSFRLMFRQNCGFEHVLH